MHRLYQIVINTKNRKKQKGREGVRIEKLDQVAGEGLAEKDI